MKKMSEQQLKQITKSAFQEFESQIDSSTLVQLKQARQLALADKEPSLNRQLVGAIVVSLGVMVAWHSSREQALQPDEFSGNEMMFSEDSQDLLMNLDFYTWLEKSQSQG